MADESMGTAAGRLLGVKDGRMDCEVRGEKFSKLDNGSSWETRNREREMNSLLDVLTFKTQN